MQTVILVVTVEPKDEWAGGAGTAPTAQEVAARLGDAARDSTRGDWETGWMVRSVAPAAGTVTLL